MAFDLRFTKGHGTGNDFVLFADPDGEIDADAAPDRRHLRPPLRRRRATASSARCAPRSLADGAAALAEDAARRVVHGLPQRRRHRRPRCAATASASSPLPARPGPRRARRGRHRSRSAPAAGVRDVQRSADGFQVDLGRWRLDGGEPLVRAKEPPGRPARARHQRGQPARRRRPRRRRRARRPPTSRTSRSSTRSRPTAPTSSSWCRPSRSSRTAWAASGCACTSAAAARRCPAAPARSPPRSRRGTGPGPARPNEWRVRGARRRRRRAHVRRPRTASTCRSAGPAELVFDGGAEPRLTVRRGARGGQPSRSVRARSTRKPFVASRARTRRRSRPASVVGEPAVQRVGAEVLLHDEPGVRPGVEPGQPVLRASRAARACRPGSAGSTRSAAKRTSSGTSSGSTALMLLRPRSRGVASHEVEGALVDVDGPHRGIRGLERQGEGDRPPAAAEVEQVSACRGQRACRRAAPGCPGRCGPG